MDAHGSAVVPLVSAELGGDALEQPAQIRLESLLGTRPDRQSMNALSAAGEPCRRLTLLAAEDREQEYADAGADAAR
jgi:hypothetical protein